MSIQNNDFNNAVRDDKTSSGSALEDLKGQASQAASSAKDTLGSMASEARNKVNDIVDHQKKAGADQLSGIARAAHSAADGLDEKSPQVARLVRDAASSVDRFAGDLRDRDPRDVLASVSDFARQQPIAFFAGSVLVGFALARFFKSEARPVTTNAVHSLGYHDTHITPDSDMSI